MKKFYYLPLELNIKNKGYKLIAGVDEAGRGPLAGPVVAAAVILPEIEIKGLQDSKRLSWKRREKICEEIKDLAISWSVGMVEVKIIDKINILRASLLAMRKAVEGLMIKPDYVLIDGNQRLTISLPQQTIIQGDAQCVSIAAASILAKVTRDRIMVEYDKDYPQYGFAKHKGYGTLLHKENLKKYGPCDLHRISFKPVKESLLKR